MLEKLSSCARLKVYTDIHRHTQTYTDIHTHRKVVELRKAQGLHRDIHRHTQTYTHVHTHTLTYKHI